MCGDNVICCAYRLPSSLKAIVLPISLASSLWRLLMVRFMVQGSRRSQLVSWWVGEGPQDEARRIKVFCHLKAANYLVFYLARRFLIRGFTWSLLTPCLHSVYGMCIQYARGHPKNQTVLRSHFPEILTHAHTVCTRPFSEVPGTRLTLTWTEANAHLDQRFVWVPHTNIETFPQFQKL